MRIKKPKLEKKSSGWIKLLVTLGVVEGLAVIIYQAVKKLKDTYHNVFLFKNEKLIYEDEFVGDSIAVCASSLVVELFDADFYEKGQVLDVFACMGNVVIQVPAGMDIFLDLDGSKTVLSSVEIAGADNNEDAYVRLKCNLFASRVEVEEKE